MIDQLGKIRTDSEDWKKARYVVTKDRIRWTVSTFVSYMAPGTDGIYPARLQKELDIIFKYPIDS